MENPPAALGLIAGKGAYPLLLADAARRQGVGRVVAVAFRKETRPEIASVADEVHWIPLGQYGRMLDTLAASGISCAVMAGQITPTHLYRIRPDRRFLDLLSRLRTRNAETIFGAVGSDLASLGIELMPASAFMEAHMATPGVLTARAPSAREQADIELGFRVAKTTSALDIGQTVVVKEGTVLAVEAFEGTDAAIRRAGKLGGPGSVVVKVAKPGHDMRFDIPVVGRKTLQVLRRARATVLALEAGRAIVLEKQELVAQAGKAGLTIVAVDGERAPSQGEAP